MPHVELQVASSSGSTKLQEIKFATSARASTKIKLPEAGSAGLIGKQLILLEVVWRAQHCPGVTEAAQCCASCSLCLIVGGNAAGCSAHHAFATAQRQAHSIKPSVSKQSHTHHAPARSYRDCYGQRTGILKMRNGSYQPAPYLQRTGLHTSVHNNQDDYGGAPLTV